MRGYCDFGGCGVVVCVRVYHWFHTIVLFVRKPRQNSTWDGCGERGRVCSTVCMHAWRKRRRRHTWIKVSLLLTWEIWNISLVTWGKEKEEQKVSKPTIFMLCSKTTNNLDNTKRKITFCIKRV